MQIPGAQLAQHLQRGRRALYALHGDEPLLQLEALDTLRRTAREAGFTERQSLTLSGAHVDWSAVLAATQSMSLFGDRQLVELRLPTGKPGKEGGAALQQIAETVAQQDAVMVVVALPRLDAATQKSAWFATLEQHGVVVRIDPIERAQLPLWIAQRLQQQGQRVPPGDEGQRLLAFMADRVEGNLLAAHQEIVKLGLLYPTGELSAAQIESAVLNVARYDPFKLTEAVLDGQLVRAQRMLDGLAAEGTAPVLVHWALADEVRSLWHVKQAVANGTPLPMALRAQRIWGAKEKRFEKILPRLTLDQLRAWVQDCHVVDGIAKGLRHPAWPHDAWAALHQLAFQIGRVCQPVRAH